MNELKPCPFCGGDASMECDYAIRRQKKARVYRVACCKCWVKDTYWHISDKASVRAWNTRAERTCKPLGTIRHDYEGGYAGTEYEIELSCGHKWRDAHGDYPDFCPWCGAKVVEE